MRLRPPVTAFVLICVFGFSSKASGTVLLNLEPSQLAERSTLVVRGTVVGQQVSADGRMIWTDTRIKVAERVAGSGATAGHFITLRQPGGETGGVGLKVPGAANFHKGEDVLVFAERDGSLLVPVGMCMGKFRLYRDARGQLRGQRDLAAISLARFDARGALEIAPALKMVGAEDPLLSDLLEVARARSGGAR